ncbi:hypothetical protein P280DRAFT_538961 [Massarina eburnea CBS 473.64]|uniref:Nephrocystin 3-like N-terminal domain-containing protein n=1 Tax=Massarina eburnea CBS 473.64 TaxID=1395130 RepID=A0A6A6SA91_9PLEO|nr:hypothetical protein P280DRAFT_538961 [Massarina eburnea CBS 473.64]
MGGLVVKQAYIIGQTDAQYIDMLSSVFGIIFPSSPHNGSAHASILNNVLAATLTISSKAYVSDLAINSGFVQNLKEKFREVCDSLHIVSIHETLATKLGPMKRMIVGKDSGVLGYPKEISSPMNADHHTVCKFQSNTDEYYTLVVTMIKRLTEELQSHRCAYALDDERSFSHAYTTVAAHRPSEGALNTYKKLEHILAVSEDPLEDLRYIVAHVMSGFGVWLHKRQSFRNWTSTSHNGPRIYWLSGLPGAGKTILAATTT